MTARAPLHISTAYFENRYRDNPDPWRFSTDWYERRKRALTLAALPRERYRVAFEPGCAQGVLTAELAARCDHLIAIDFVPHLVQRAQRRVEDQPNVTVARHAFPLWWPTGLVDLLVISEVGYYLTSSGVSHLQRRITERVADHGDIVSVHYTDPTDYPTTAEELVQAIDSLACVTRTSTHIDERFRIDIWKRTPRSSESDG